MSDEVNKNQVDRLRNLLAKPGSDSPATQSTAAASGASAGALVVILIWLISLAHITVPAEVATAFTVLTGAAVHWIMITYGMGESP
jgi:hypothetical protein